MALHELTPGQEALVGKWHLERSENFDDYMKILGINIIKRTIGNNLKPDIIITHNAGDVHHWKVYVRSTFKNTDWTFFIGDQTEQKTIDGRMFWTTVTWDGDVLVETQEAHEDNPNEVPSVIRRYVNDEDILVAECKAGGVVARRYFKRIDSEQREFFVLPE